MREGRIGIGLVVRGHAEQGGVDCGEAAGGLDEHVPRDGRKVGRHGVGDVDPDDGVVQQPIGRSGRHVEQVQADVCGVRGEYDQGRRGAAARIVPVRHVCKGGGRNGMAGAVACDVGGKLEYGGACGYGVDRCARRPPVGYGQACVGCGQCRGRVRRHVDAVECEHAAHRGVAGDADPGLPKVQYGRAATAGAAACPVPHRYGRVPHGRAGAADRIARLVGRVVQVPQRAGDVSRHVRACDKSVDVPPADIVSGRLEVDGNGKVVVPQRRRVLHDGGRKVRPSRPPRAAALRRGGRQVDTEVRRAFWAGSAASPRQAGKDMVHVHVRDRGMRGLGAVPRPRPVHRADRRCPGRAVVRRGRRRCGVPPHVGRGGVVPKLGGDSGMRRPDRAEYP